MVKNKKTTLLLVFSRILKQLRMNDVKTTTQPTLFLFVWGFFCCFGGGDKLSCMCKTDAAVVVSTADY